MSDPDPVQFTRESAFRIANVVRRVETDAPKAKPLTFDAIMPSGRPKAFRMGSFDGEWLVGGNATITLHGSTHTVNATNLLIDVPAAGTRSCAIAKDGTAWYLVFPQAWTREVTLGDVSPLRIFGDTPASTAVMTFLTGLSTATSTIITDVATATHTFITAFDTATHTFLQGISISAVLNTADCSISIQQETQGTSFITLASLPQTATATFLLGPPQTATAVIGVGTPQTATAVVFQGAGAGQTIDINVISSPYTARVITMEPY